MTKSADSLAVESATDAKAGRNERPSLLLLPFPPTPTTRTLLSAAYRPSLAAALTKLRNPQGAEKLVIAVACPILHGQHLRSKSVLWPEAQALLAGIYTLLSVVCAELKIGVEVDGGPGSVDATVIPLDHDRKRHFLSESQPAIKTNSTIVVDLATFALAYHPWKSIFHVRSEPGLELFNAYIKLAEGRQTLLQSQLVPVEGGLALNATQESPPTHSPPTTGYSVVCLGGTFDYLHPGHKLLLTAAALLLQVPDAHPSRPCQFIIGVTGDELLKNKKYAEYVQPWAARARNVILFLSRLLRVSEKGWKDGPLLDIDEQDGDFRASFRDSAITVQCVRIHDAFGPTVTVQDMDALVVSGETRSGGRAVNDRRAEKGWRCLEIFEVDVLDAGEITDEAGAPESFASKISSTAIRQQRARNIT
ncbi:hypothetical protein QBC34DRAFT_377663 [Podospora aff. communis PSN243]|uniref:Cytidyltransferase-like domain-containing protein n=1 Tax=Podospora aff. communis PSN243 TaxID=3040156 RepID=A0AAV9GW85_9PEZI|nr:hypothetical protein QBC34DRAFT_377663 [Podospora aff. communis PSN243]